MITAGFILINKELIVMKNYLIAIVLLACFVPTAALAQVSSPNDSVEFTQLKLDVAGKKIRWDASSLRDLISGEFISPHNCYFNTEGLQRIQWVQSDGKMIYSFLVKSSTQNSDGYYHDRIISYDVELDDLAGRIEIFKRDSGIIVVVNIKSGDGVTIQNEYSIANYEIQQL